MEGTSPVRTLMFVREDNFYFLNLPMNDDLAEHARANPGTIRIEDLFGKVLWPPEGRKPPPTIRQLWDDHAEWSQETFGSDTELGPIGALKHLQKEADEAMDDPSDVMEYADMLLLLIDSARRAGHTWDGLVNAADEKLHTVLKSRTYPKPKDGEPSFHVKGVEVIGVDASSGDDQSVLSCPDCGQTFDTVEDWQKHTAIDSEEN